MMTKGIHAKYFCQLYMSTAIPHILYAADIFLTSQRNVGKHSDSHTIYQQVIVNKLATIYRRVTILITGTLNSSVNWNKIELNS